MKNKSVKKITVGRLGVVFGICIAMVMSSAVTTLGDSQTQNNQTIDQLSYSFAFKEPSMQSIQAFGSDYTTITMPGCLAIGKQAGDPAMPVKMIKLYSRQNKQYPRLTSSEHRLSFQILISQKNQFSHLNSQFQSVVMKPQNS